MPLKKIAPRQEHGFIGDKKSTAKPKPPYVKHPFEIQYIMDREQVFKLIGEGLSMDEIRNFISGELF